MSTTRPAHYDFLGRAIAKMQNWPDRLIEQRMDHYHDPQMLGSFQRSVIDEAQRRGLDVPAHLIP